MPTFQYRALTRGRRSRHRLARRIERGRGQSTRRISGTDPDRSGDGAKRSQVLTRRFLVRPAAPGGRHDFHRRPGFAAARAGLASTTRSNCWRATPIWPHAPDGDGARELDSIRRELRRGDRQHPRIFPPIYVALIRIGETSGALVTVLEALVAERQRAEALSRRISDALRYPAFLLLRRGRGSAVLPQLSSCRNSPTSFATSTPSSIRCWPHFLGLSDFMRSNGQTIAAVLLVRLSPGWFILRRRPREDRSFARWRACRSCVRSWTTTARASSAAT